MLSLNLIDIGTGAYINYKNGTSTSQASYPTSTGQDSQIIFMPACVIINPQYELCSAPDSTAVV